MPPLIRVTEDHIETAVPKDSSHCMIADAIKAVLPKARRVSVDLQTIRFTRPELGTRYEYFTPPVAQRALLDFDNGEPIEPFDFRLGRAVVEHEAKASEKRTDKGRKVQRRRGGQRSKVRGGKPLPRAQLGTLPVKTGRRREYGLRAMGR